MILRNLITVRLVTTYSSLVACSLLLVGGFDFLSLPRVVRPRSRPWIFLCRLALLTIVTASLSFLLSCLYSLFLNLLWARSIYSVAAVISSSHSFVPAYDSSSSFSSSSNPSLVCATIAGRLKSVELVSTSHSLSQNHSFTTSKTTLATLPLFNTLHVRFRNRKNYIAQITAYLILEKTSSFVGFACQLPNCFTTLNFG